MSGVEQYLKNELDSQKQVSIQAGNPQYESILNLEEIIKTQMDQIGNKPLSLKRYPITTSYWKID